jgi:uncharacterized protein YbbC (DUF1343 family)
MQGMAVCHGLDRLALGGFAKLRGRRIGVVCNQATVTGGLVHILDRLLAPDCRGAFEVVAAFGPQHGIWGHTQDNMIEWEGYRDPATGIMFHSLYGEHREPTPEMLEGIDLLLVDLPDIGTRYYTFIWTLALCMKACERIGIEVLVLDRPNPLGGLATEGPVLDPAYASFVGLYPLPARHGMTLGEVGRYLRAAFFPKVRLEVMGVEGWSRAEPYDATGLPWIMPSPNMPTLDTAWVYPGMCLLEGTTLSEGRGTTRPFETFGAPGLDGRALAEALRAEPLEGCVFRPVQFQPAFHKHCGRICGGAFLHVTDRTSFRPVLTSIAVLKAIRSIAPGALEWLPPPYEYEYERLPIDILFGNSWCREWIDAGRPLAEFRDRMDEEALAFEPLREAALLYP